MRKFLAIQLVVTFLIVGCATPTLSTPRTQPLSTLPVSIPTLTSTKKAILAPTQNPTDLITPTARIFSNTANCNDAEGNGHIFLLGQTKSDNMYWAYNMDLIIMNGNGCYPKLIMTEVSGSPALSKDWKFLAIGCKQNSYLCILDIEATLNSCQRDDSYYKEQCKPSIVQEFALPSGFGDKGSLNHISWSANGTSIAIDNEISVFVLDMSNRGKWKLLITEEWGSAIDWSPKEGKLITSGLYFIDSNGEKSDRLTAGIEPVWSPDGSRIVFAKASNDDTKEPWGIAVLDSLSNEWQWLYQPANRDNYYWPPQNLSIGSNNGTYRWFSWSPNMEYIAFSTLHHHMFDQQIFRLNTSTGEIITLTEDLPNNYYWAPAWAP